MLFLLNLIMINTISWDIKDVEKNDTHLRIGILYRIHNISILVLFEPLVHAFKINICQNQLGFCSLKANVYGKNLILWKKYININIISDFDQVFHCSLCPFNVSAMRSFVYVRSFKSDIKRFCKIFVILLKLMLALG